MMICEIELHLHHVHSGNEDFPILAPIYSHLFMLEISNEDLLDGNHQS